MEVKYPQVRGGGGDVGPTSGRYGADLRVLRALLRSRGAVRDAFVSFTLILVKPLESLFFVCGGACLLSVSSENSYLFDFGPAHVVSFMG